MRLLHIMAEMDPTKGGVGQAVRTMMLGLSLAGIENEVVTSDAAGSPFIEHSPSIIHALGPGGGPWNYSPQMLPWLIKNIGFYDVVIVHGLWLYHGYAVQKALKVIKKQRLPAGQISTYPRLFVMPHGMIDPYFQKAKGRKLKAIRNWLYWKLVEGKLVNRANGLLFTSSEEQRLARIPFRPYKPKRELVTGLGLEDPPPFRMGMMEAFYSKCPQAAGNPYILFLGRIDKKKGVDLLVRAYMNLANSNVDPGISLPTIVIAGPGLETTYGKELQHLTSVMLSKIIFAGMLLADAKWGAFYGCDAFILPSHQENFGIAVVESLACGKPVLISNQVNIWKEIKSAGAAIVADDTFAGTIELLTSWINLSKSEKLNMQQNAIECYRQFFALKAASQRIKDAVCL